MFGALISGFSAWTAWRFTRTHKSIKADEDNAFADVMGKMVPVIDKIQSPYKDDLKRINDKLDSLTNEYVKLKIEFGILEALSKQKDLQLVQKDEEIRFLKQRIKELEAA